MIIDNMYHGTSERFSLFNLSAKKNVKSADTMNVVYTTNSEKEAKLIGHPQHDKSIVIKLSGVLNNPYVVDAKGTEKQKSFGRIGYEKIISIARRMGCDGVIIENVIDFSDEPQTTYIFFDVNNLIPV